MKWSQLTDEEKQDCYLSYVDSTKYEWGDNAIYMTFKEWCKESELLGEPLM